MHGTPAGDALDGQALALSAALWLALLRFRSDRTGDHVRLVLGLAAGAALAHLGWLGLHPGRLTGPEVLLGDPRRGLCVLFAPLGPLGVGLSLPDRARRRAFAAECARVLPLALACARLGCLGPGCCGGAVLTVCEALGLGLLHGCVTCTGPARRLAIFSAGFGLLRLLAEPWRPVPPTGPPDVPVEGIALAWIAAGLVAALVSRGRIRDRLGFLRERSRLDGVGTRRG